MGLQRRWDLGAVCAGNEDVDGRICLATARGRASNVREKCRTGVNPDEIVAYCTGGRDALEARREAAKAPARSWTWEKAKSEYSAHLSSNNRQATKTDYEKKLRLPELSRFAGRAMPSITANEIAKAYADIHSRSRSTGHAFRRVIKAFWTYLGDATRADETSVTIDLTRLKKVPDPRSEIGDPNTPFDPEEEHGDAPPEIELGRLLAISRCAVQTRQRFDAPCLGVGSQHAGFSIGKAPTTRIMAHSIRRPVCDHASLSRTTPRRGPTGIVYRDMLGVTPVRRSKSSVTSRSNPAPPGSSEDIESPTRFRDRSRIFNWCALNTTPPTDRSIFSAIKGTA
jgi:hypothetical protein